MKNEIEQLLRDIVTGFTRFHDELKIESHETERSLFITISAHADDVGKIIGSQGVMVKALRRVLMAAARDWTRVSLSVNEPTKGERFPQASFHVNQDYDPEPERALLERVGRKMFGEVKAASSRVNHEASMLTLTTDRKHLCRLELEDELATIFHAIGKAKGRNLFVEVS